MKILLTSFGLMLAALGLALMCGCADVGSRTGATTTTTITSFTNSPTNNVTVIVDKEWTHMHAYAFLDSNQSMGKFANRSRMVHAGTNGAFAPGTYIGTVNESANSGSLTNIIKLLEIIAPMAGGL